MRRPGAIRFRHYVKKQGSFFGALAGSLREVKSSSVLSAQKTTCIFIKNRESILITLLHMLTRFAVYSIV